MEEMKKLPARATRGLRMAALIGEEAEKDEEFWQSDMFKEEEEDQVFQPEVSGIILWDHLIPIIHLSKFLCRTLLARSLILILLLYADEEDEVDSDFDAPEQDDQEDEEENEDAKPLSQKRKRKSYVDPLLRKNQKKAKKAASIQKAKTVAERNEEEEEEEKEGEEDGEETEQMQSEEDRQQRGTRKKDKEKEEEGPPKRRKSSRPSTVASGIEREIRAKKETEEQQRKKKRQPKNVRVVRLTQEELLAEARVTEQINAEILDNLLRLEEQKKQPIRVPRQLSGQYIRFNSKPNGDTLTFVNRGDFPPELRPSQPPYMEQPKCVITGQPAKYKDPKTGLWYANAQAFAALRARYPVLESTAADSSSSVSSSLDSSSLSSSSAITVG
ncbi:Vacuolar protein sorting-associated protein 72 [Balamuthia mandrillaris]